MDWVTSEKIIKKIIKQNSLENYSINILKKKMLI